MEPLLLSIPDAAKLVGIGPDQAREFVRTGAWPSVRVGVRRRKVSRAWLVAHYGSAPAAEVRDA